MPKLAVIARGTPGTSIAAITRRSFSAAVTALSVSVREQEDEFLAVPAREVAGAAGARDGHSDGGEHLVALLVPVEVVDLLEVRPRKRPERVLADRGYDHDKYRRLLRARGIAHSIARRQTEHGSGLGPQRYVVERTISHLHTKRRLLVCTDRQKRTHDAFLSLAACLLCYHRLRDSLS